MLIWANINDLARCLGHGRRLTVPAWSPLINSRLIILFNKRQKSLLTNLLKAPLLYKILTRMGSFIVFEWQQPFDHQLGEQQSPPRHKPIQYDTVNSYKH